MKTHPKTYCAAAAAAIALASPIAGTCGEEIDQTLEMQADGMVQVENLAGNVEFASWDRDEVQIRGEAGDDVEEVEITSTSKGVQVRVRNPKNKRRIDGTDLYLRIPEGASIEGEGVSADFKVEGNKGPSIILNTVSGDLQVDASPARMELASVSGDIEFEGKVSRSAVETVSGDITKGGEVDRGRFESVSGEMTLTLSITDAGRLNCDSMSGDINLMLPASQQADFNAQSYSGDIHTDFGKSVSVSKGPGTVLEHRVGDNGAKVSLESFSGDISISSR
jgi:DUF4097 and DUF4098 domain-containing protein YvlB